MFYVGLDVASEKHDCCILNEKKKIFRSFSISNSAAGFDSLLAALAELSSDEIKIGLEATGIYSENLSVFLRRKGFDVSTINPLLIKKHQCATTLRKTKTDKADAKGIAQFIAEEGFQPDLPVSYHIQELKSLSRARFSVVQDRSALKNKVKRLVVLLFPELLGEFSDIFGNSAAALLKQYPSAAKLAACHCDTLAALLRKTSRGRFGRAKAEHLRQLAQNSVGNHSSAKAMELRMLLKRIDLLSEQIAEYDREIKIIMDKIDSPILSIPGIYKAIQDPVMVIAAKDVNKNVSPLRSTHSVVAIVDIGSAKKSLLVPIEITAERKVNGARMDVNTISSVYEKSVKSLVTEAIAQENAGNIGIFYAKKEAMTLPGAGVQFPVQLQQSIASNGIVHRFSEKVNMKISSVTQSQQFKRWFGDWQNDPAHASKVVNADGTPKVVYHQTDADFTIFDPRHEGAGTRDSDTPFGIFLKSSDKNIGLKGNRQMALYVDIKNPLTVRNREQLIHELQKISDGYATALAEHQALDAQYKQKTDDAIRELREYMVQWRRDNPDASRTALYDDSRFNQLFNAEDNLTDEWESKAREIELRSKEAITRDLEAAGYDGVIIQQDVGSFVRSTDAYIALHPEQVKSATDNIGTFDGKNPDIRYSRELELDSEGNTLTQEQTDFFADSEVRNDDGELIQVYHKTTESFTVFKRGKLGEETLWNASDASLAATSLIGHWFSDSENTPFMGNAMKTYLNIRNPYYTSLDELAADLGDFSGDLEMMQDHFYSGQYNMVREAARSYVRWMKWKGYDGLMKEPGALKKGGCHICVSFLLGGQPPEGPPWLPDGVVLRAANQNSNDCQWQSSLDSIAGSPQGLTCAPAGAMQASNRR